MSLVDDVMAVRLLYLFTTPFEKFEAFKHGIIDKNGKILRKYSSLKTTAEKDSWSMLHRLAARLKIMLSTSPLGKSALVSYAAAYLLVREHYDVIKDDNCEELFVEYLNQIEDGQIELTEATQQYIKKILEDAPVNVSAGIQADVPRINTVKRGRKVRYQKVGQIAYDVMKRNLPKTVNEDEDLILNVNGNILCESIHGKMTENDHQVTQNANINAEKLVQQVGEKAAKVIFKHEWYRRYCESPMGIATSFRVTINPTTSFISVGASYNGKVMVKFDLTYNRKKISNAHLFHHGGQKWKYVKSQNSLKEDVTVADLKYGLMENDDLLVEGRSQDVIQKEQPKDTTKLTEIKIDNDNGWGQTPNNSNVDYRGLRVQMKPSVFLKLAANLEVGKEERESIDAMKDHAQNGGTFGAPTLYVKAPDSWYKNKVSGTAEVRGHEGRHRMNAHMELEGDTPVETHIFVNDFKNKNWAKDNASDYTSEVISALNDGIMSEEGRHVSGPLFLYDVT